MVPLKSGLQFSKFPLKSKTNISTNPCALPCGFCHEHIAPTTNKQQHVATMISVSDAPSTTSNLKHHPKAEFLVTQWVSSEVGLFLKATEEKWELRTSVTRNHTQMSIRKRGNKEQPRWTIWAPIGFPSWRFICFNVGHLMVFSIYFLSKPFIASYLGHGSSFWFIYQVVDFTYFWAFGSLILPSIWSESFDPKIKSDLSRCLFFNFSCYSQFMGYLMINCCPYLLEKIWESWKRNLGLFAIMLTSKAYPYTKTCILWRKNP